MVVDVVKNYISFWILQTKNTPQRVSVSRIRKHFIAAGASARSCIPLFFTHSSLVLNL
jgi:hypothetical protein